MQNHTPIFISKGLRTIAAALAMTAVAPSFLMGQTSRGPTEDATVLKKGVFEVDFGADWRSAYDRYVNRNGSNKTEPIGKIWSFDSLTTRQLPALTPLQNLIRSLTGDAAASVSLGGTNTKVTQRTTVVPFAISAGVTKRLTIGVTVPIVQVQSDVYFNTTNAVTGSANISVNPALSDASVFASDTTFVNQMIRSVSGIRSYCAGAGSGSAACTNSGALTTEAEQFANALYSVYAEGLFVPLAGSTLQNAVATRSLSFVNNLNSFAGIAGSGVPQITATGVSAATLPVSTPDLQFMVQSTAFGLNADSIASIRRWNVGDVQLNAKFLVFEGLADTASGILGNNIRTRLSVGGSLRLPTGHTPSSDNYFDLASGIDALGIGAAGYFDVAYRNRLLTSIVAKYDMNFSSAITTRIWDSPDQVFLESFRTASVDRKVGNAFQIHITPKYLINDFLSIGVNYSLLNKQSDSYSGAAITVPAGDSTGGMAVTLNPSSMNAGSAYTDHKIGIGFSFSNVKSYKEGKARLPFEVSYFRSQSIAGSGGYFVKQNQDMMKMKLYFQIFGR